VPDSLSGPLTLLALAASVAPLSGLALARAAGASRPGRSALWTWLTASAVLTLTIVAGVGLSALHMPLQFGPFPVLPALLALVVAGPTAGVLIARVRVLTRWRRWTPLGLALAQLAEVMPLLHVAAFPGPVLLPVLTLLVGVALVADPLADVR
jgi:hypothetical protein